MTVCPKCEGSGELRVPVTEHMGTVLYGTEQCDECGGSGYVNMTNEEWMRSATFEELAGAIYEWHTKGYARGRLEVGLNPITEVVEWLKEIHE